MEWTLVGHAVQFLFEILQTAAKIGGVVEAGGRIKFFYGRGWIFCRLLV